MYLRSAAFSLDANGLSLGSPEFFKWKTGEGPRLAAPKSYFTRRTHLESL